MKSRNSQSVRKDTQGTVEEAKVSVGGCLYNVFKNIYRKAFMVLFMLATMATPTFAATGAADDKWSAVIDFITPWISRVGGLIIVFGAVELGLSFKDDNADGKTKGIRFVVAGLIVFAVGLSTDLFLAA